MMNKLEKLSLIKRENLNQEYYLQSILQEAYRLHLLTDSELENIQQQSIRLLARQTERYTAGESSSVKVETAQTIWQSIGYTVGIYLKSIPDTDTSITVLKQTPLSEQYRLGKDLIKAQFDRAKQLFNAIQNNSISTDNCAYNDTIHGIPVFFNSYDVDYAAHDNPADIDYPLGYDKMGLVGIEYIYNYLQKLYLENQFCKNFAMEDIHCLLRGYDDNYKDLLVNIFRLVLTNALGCVLANKNSLQLNMELSDIQYLQQKFANIPTYLSPPPY